MSAQVISGSISLDLGTTSNASEIIVHEDFDPQIAASDIGLIKLDTPLKFDGGFLLNFKLVFLVNVIILILS